MNKTNEPSSKLKILKRGKLTLLACGLLLGSGLYAETLTWTQNTAFSKTLTEDSTLEITSDNTISGSSFNLNAIYIDGASKANSISVTNNGTITLTNSTTLYTRGIYTSYIKSGSSITNNGTINVEGFGLVYGISTDLSGNIFSNTGTIISNAKDHLSTGGSSSAIHFGHSEAGSASNSGTVTAKENGALGFSSYSLDYDSYANALTFENSGTMNGNIKLPKGTFTNTGTISLPYNAKGSFSALIENFTNQGTGKLEIGFKTTDGTLANTTYSKLSTTNATFENGSTIHINVLDGTNISNLVGTTLTGVISATNALTINGTLNITDNSDLVDFIYVEGGGIKIVIPTSEDKSFTIDEDTSKTFASSDFSFEGVGTLQKIIITTLPSVESLKLNGADVTLNQEIAVADISNLVFTPASNANGTPYATFGFKVSNGEVSSDEYNATINVTAVDDAPIIDMTTSYNNISNGENYSITLNSTDVDGDAIGYTASSNDTTKATVAIVDGKLVVSPLNGAEGSVTVVLNAVSNGKVTSQEITIDLTTPSVTSVSNLSAGKWNMISLPKGKVLNTTGLGGITSGKAVKVFRSGAWVENPTDVTAKEAIWINPTSTTLDLSTATASTANDFADKTAQFAYYKTLSTNAWHFVSVQYTMNWSDLTKAVLTPDSCDGYTFIKYYDSANDSWNTTANIPAGSGVWLRHLCK